MFEQIMEKRKSNSFGTTVWINYEKILGWINADRIFSKFDLIHFVYIELNA